MTIQLRTHPELHAGLNEIRQSPKNEGILRMIVRRPKVGEREMLEEGTLNQVEGLVGDNWKGRENNHTPGQPANPDSQLTLINSRLIALLAIELDRWSLAGDQLYVDLDLSEDNLPPGTQLKVGAAIIEITEKPHTGCKDFADRFGVEALKFVNSPLGRQLNLRGVYARVIKAGTVRLGDKIAKV